MRISDWSSGVCSSDLVFAWGETRQVRTATYTLNDFHFPAPKANLVAKSTNPLDHGHAKGEVYDYPGKYEKAKGGETLAKVRLEEAQARYRVAEGEATARGLAVGALFTLSGFPRQDQNVRSEEHTSELQSLMRIPYAVFC